MNQTQQYKLPQWEKTDRIVMEDFNDQARRLETALTSHDADLAGLTSEIGRASCRERVLAGV